MNILVADDDRRVRDFVAQTLLAENYTPITVASGLDAIRVAEKLRPSVVILDGLLPELHGFEVARFIRKLSSFYRPRIIVMTAIYKNNRYESEARLRYGVDRYLVKPVSRELLLSAVREPQNENVA